MILTKKVLSIGYPCITDSTFYFFSFLMYISFRHIDNAKNNKERKFKK